MVTLKTVVLDDDKCIGCITCMRRCPTEAIRIVNGKAKIQYDKCINCGECVRSCKGGAKRPVYDGFDLVRSYAYKIALPSPSLFGQFNNLNDPNYVIEGLKALGFDEVFEVGLAAELVTDCTKKLMPETVYEIRLQTEDGGQTDCDPKAGSSKTTIILAAPH